jgi:hypothetical protein
LKNQKGLQIRTDTTLSQRRTSKEKEKQANNSNIINNITKSTTIIKVQKTSNNSAQSHP